MKVLIKIRNSPEQIFLVDLKGKTLIKDIKGYVNAKKLDKAIVETLSRGRFEKELRHDELLSANADLVLTKNNARWDIVKNSK
ncbi:MAG: hypothetical protein ISS92_03570 [Candidatus Omnitrophica bacterium]|nr:hypothetical protein [Candidatus Omnitrophota bacterium]